MAHRSLEFRRRGNIAWIAFPAFTLLLALGGCEKNEVGELDAQEENLASETESQAEAAAPDTVSMTVEQALALVTSSVSAAQDAAAEAAATSGTTPEAGAGTATPAAPATPASTTRYNAGEDPDYALRMGWPVQGPATLPGAILPDNRIVCYYGNPNSARMGALGEYPKEEMLSRLRRQISAWETADPTTPVKPCLHMVSVVAQGEAGTSGHYRSIMRDATVQMVYDWAKEINGIFIVDIQVGTDDIRNILPRFEWILKNPDVHLAIDPEFYMKNGSPPGKRIGTMDAADINYASDYLANLVRENNLPPKVLIIHRFTRPMVTNYRDIRLHPEAQVVLHMDGWGAPWLKRDSYRDYIVSEPVQYTGFKLFYGNDTKSGTPLMQPADLLRLRPTPIYVQYQ
ncbi:MAG: hypothetical protein LBG44_05210 [Gemmatimonadota bacterium]|nr:hypothetical protein [Gemmatimonadota bacterium]